MSKAPGESEHLKDMLVGNILSVQWPEVWTTAALYVAIGLFHRQAQVSSDFGRCERRRRAGHLDPPLGLSFLCVVRVRRHAIGAIAGVLLVFCYLIVPSIAGILFSDRVGPRLAIGWAMGVVVSMLGMYFSVVFDLPTGATIICTFGAVLVLMASVRALLLSKDLGFLFWKAKTKRNPRSSPFSAKLVLKGEQGQLEPVRHAALLEDARQVLFDGVLADAEARGDVAVRRAAGDRLDDLDLAAGEAEARSFVALRAREAGRRPGSRPARDRPGSRPP